MPLLPRPIAFFALVWLVVPAIAVYGQETPADPPAAETEVAKPLFPDTALEAAVRAEVFAKRNNQEPITKEDVATISRVVASGKKIKSLEGLEHCPALMMLDLADNEITDLKPIAGLKRLQSVTLANNKITDIAPLAELTAMQLLDLSGNQLSDTSALGKMANLRTLYLAKNQLKSIDGIKGLSKIWSLDVSENQLTDLAPVVKLTWLSTLDIAGNQIASLEPLTGLGELNMLIMQRNQVSDLSPLVEMCRKDFQGDRRFAPFLQVFLSENPIEAKKLETQRSELLSFGVKVTEK